MPKCTVETEKNENIQNAFHFCTIVRALNKEYISVSESKYSNIKFATGSHRDTNKYCNCDNNI